MNSHSYKIASFGALTALAFLFSYIETLIPLPLGIPGLKLGLANLVIVLALYQNGTRSALTISLVRMVLVSFTFGSLASLIYSIAGGLLSFLVMAFFKKKDTFSIIGVSVLGGITHNLGQILAAMILVSTTRIFYYFAFLFLAGAITGFVIGYLAKECIKRLPDSLSDINNSN